LRRDSPYAICTGINPAFCEALLDRTLQFWLDYYSGLLAEVGDLVDVVMIGDDLAGQNGPLFCPDFYRKVVKPRQKRLIGHIKSLTSAKLWYHSCGSVVQFIPDLLEIGVDILNPIQVGARDMDRRRLKQTFGQRLCFWGGAIDAQHVLPNATAAGEYRRPVRRGLRIRFLLTRSLRRPVRRGLRIRFLLTRSLQPRLRFDEQPRDLPPRDREVLMVFQDCALYPHISAYQNTVLPLRARGARTERITEAVRQIPVYLNRRPGSKACTADSRPPVLVSPPTRPNRLTV